MSRVITFSRVYPSYHPRKGEETYFVEKFWQSIFNLGVSYKTYGLDNELEIFSNPSHFIIPKNHTIRAGNRWKVGDKFSPRVWGNDINPKSGKKGAYQSKQIIIAPDIEIKKIWSFEIKERELLFDGKILGSTANIDCSVNDGLEYKDFLAWFKYPKPFSGQIICWNDKISYN